MIEMWLPIGSVVLLKGGKHPLMIYGRRQMNMSGEGETTYDYTACLYPEGNIDAEFNYLFNKDQIEHILFMGYQTPEEFAFADKLDGLPMRDMKETHVQSN